MSTSTNWKIDDSMFYPLGLFNNSTIDKTVFVAWGYNAMKTFIFKKINNSNALSCSYDINMSDTLRTIIVTDRNTICLTKNGKIYYFSSSVNLKCIKSLTNIRCICVTKNGFALIRIDPDEKRIICEEYADFGNTIKDIEEKRSLRKYDLTFDEVNLMQNMWSDEQFCIKSVQIDDGNRQLMESVVKMTIKANDLFFISIANNLFYVMDGNDVDAQDNNYEIGIILTVASQIDDILFLDGTQAIALQLSCGIIEILYYSQLMEILDRTSLTIGANRIANTFSENSFYYSDERNIVRAFLYYDIEQDKFCVKKYQRKINGIVAMTWVSSLKKLVCLSENNIFYKIKFTPNSCNNPKKSDANLIPLNEKMEEIQLALNTIDEIIELPGKINTNIRNEYYKQELLGIVTRKQFFNDKAKAIIEFHSDVPKTVIQTFHCGSNKSFSSRSFFAQISIEIEWNEYFTATLWSVEINSRQIETNSKFYVTLNSEILKNRFQILLHMRREKVLVIPEFQITLCSSVQAGNDFLHLAIPVKITKINFDNLFKINQHKIVCDQQEQMGSIEQKILRLALDQHNENDEANVQLKEKLFSYTMKTPLLFTRMDFNEIYSNKNENDENQIDGQILGEKIVIVYNEIENFVQIVTRDPGILYYAKRMIGEKIYSDDYDDDTIDIHEAKKGLVKLQAETEAISGCTENISENLIEANLKDIYDKLRSFGVKPF